MFFRLPGFYGQLAVIKTIFLKKLLHHCKIVCEHIDLALTGHIIASDKFLTEGAECIDQIVGPLLIIIELSSCITQHKSLQGKWNLPGI